MGVFNQPLPEVTAQPARVVGADIRSCPAQRFSISAIRIDVRRLVERYELQPRFTTVTPRPRQIGGVARAAQPCVVSYTLRG